MAQIKFFFCSMKSAICIGSFSLFAGPWASAQHLTNEDFLNVPSSKTKTVISGYGSAYYQRDFNRQLSAMTLERAVLFVGHRFNDKISFFSELELENAKIAAGESGKGEVAMEQAYLKFNLNP